MEHVSRFDSCDQIFRCFFFRPNQIFYFLRKRQYLLHSFEEKKNFRAGFFSRNSAEKKWTNQIQIYSTVIVLCCHHSFISLLNVLWLWQKALSFLKFYAIIQSFPKMVSNKHGNPLHILFAAELRTIFSMFCQFFTCLLHEFLFVFFFFRPISIDFHIKSMRIKSTYFKMKLFYCNT